MVFIRLQSKVAKPQQPEEGVGTVLCRPFLCAIVLHDIVDQFLINIIESFFS